MRTPNEQRSDRAHRLLLIARQWSGDPHADEDTIVIDLLTDILHYAPDYGVDVDNCLRIAKAHHEAETA